MTISLTSLTAKQWKSVGKVCLWLVVTNGIGIVVAWLTNQPALLALGPTLNGLGVTLTKVAQSEEDLAITGADLPAVVVGPMTQIPVTTPETPEPPAA